MGELRDLLERLSNEFGPAGCERSVRRLIRAEIESQVDRLEADALGNLVAFKAAAPENDAAPRLKVMLAAHMDEVGFMVTEVGKNGLLKFQTVGGVDVRTLLGKRVVIGEGRTPGVVGAPVPHLERGEAAHRVPSIEDLTIDVGATDDKGTNGKVKAGDYGTFATSFTVLHDDPAWPTVRGKAFDDRAGCAALIALLAERYPVDVYAAFTVQEEVGLRGARVAAHRVDPDAAIALEGTVCDDLPQQPDEDATRVTHMGQGPAITLMDRSLVSHPGMLRLLQETAAAENIPVQYKAPGLGGTDSGAIHQARAGVPSITVAVPCRYIHSPAAILNLNDLAATVALVRAALRRIDRSYLARAS